MVGGGGNHGRGVNFGEVGVGEGMAMGGGGMAGRMCSTRIDYMHWSRYILKCI